MFFVAFLFLLEVDSFSKDLTPLNLNFLFFIILLGANSFNIFEKIKWFHISLSQNLSKSSISIGVRSLSKIFNIYVSDISFL